MAKCPKGVICFENFTFIFIIIALIFVIYLMYAKQSVIAIDCQYRSAQDVEYFKDYH